MKKLNGFIQTDLGLNSALVIFPAQGPWPLWPLLFLHCKKPTPCYGFICMHTYVYISYILQNLIKAHPQYQFNSTTFNNTKLILVKRGAGEPRERCPRKLRKNRKTTWTFPEVPQLTRDPTARHTVEALCFVIHIPGAPASQQWQRHACALTLILQTPPALPHGLAKEFLSSIYD